MYRVTLAANLVRISSQGNFNHYQTIDSGGQVQVHEAIMGDEAARVTHSLMQASDYLKDNRL